MKNIGLVVAVEIDTVIEKYGVPIKEEKINAYNVLTYKLERNATLYVVHCGAGEIAAAAATQFLISRLNCEMIVNFGIVGGLTKEMSVEKICIVEKVVHYDFDVSSFGDGSKVGEYEGFGVYLPATKMFIDKALEIEPSLKKVVCASGDKFVEGYKSKRKLHKQFSADICEMEAAGIALTCLRNSVPFLMIKCVSDGAKGGSNEFNLNFNKAASICLNLTDKIIKLI